MHNTLFFNHLKKLPFSLHSKTPPFHRLIAPPQGFTVPCMEATHGFFLRSTEFRPQQRRLLFCRPQRKNGQTQPEINSGWRSMFSKFLWPWGWSDFQCATLGSCDSCCVHCPPHSPAPKDLGPNCDTCGSNGNPIIPFLGKRPRS